MSKFFGDGACRSSNTLFQYSWIFFVVHLCISGNPMSGDVWCLPFFQQVIILFALLWLFLKLICNEDSDRKLCMIACREEIKPERSHHRRHSGRGSLPVSCWAVDFLIDTAV